MPRYFFNTRIGDELIADPEGEELRNPDRAWEIARAMIRELLKTEGADGGLLQAILEVTDEEGEIVLEAVATTSTTSPPQNTDVVLPSFRGAHSANPESKDCPMCNCTSEVRCA